ncbi:hypothetical protein EsH8_I_000183 [Colletotrichum jinshuiense]
MALGLLICAFGGWIIFAIQTRYGLGKHFLTIDKKYDIVAFRHATFWQSIISASGAIMWLKISIALNLLRLITTKSFRWALWVTIVFTFLYCVGGMFPFFFHCKPMSGFWDKNTKPPPTCKSGNTLDKFGLVNTCLAFNIITDLILALLPVPIIWALQMKQRVRIYVIGILSLGYFAVAMGIVKAFYQITASTDSDKTFNQSIQLWGLMLRLSSYDNYTHDLYGSRSRRKGTANSIPSNREVLIRDGTLIGRVQYELDEWNVGSSNSSHGLSNANRDERQADDGHNEWQPP